MAVVLEPEEKERLNEELSKVKIGLLSSRGMVFFSTVCLNLNHHFDSVGTACTDGRFVKYDPVFWNKCTPSERVGLMLHETLHVVFNHMSRLKERDHKRWNAACDYVINLIVTDNNIKLPQDGLWDEKYRDMSADEVYNLLEPEEYENAPDHLIQPGTEEDAEELKEYIDQVLIEADVQARMAGGDNPGKIPGEIQFYINKLLKPRLKLGPKLRRYFNGFVRKDYSYNRINRRFNHVKMPSLRSPAMGTVAVAVDTSASVKSAEFDRIIGEVSGIIQSTKPDKLELISFDQRIQNQFTLKKLHELGRLQFSGRGGTAIRPVMDWAITHEPRVLVVFSDGFFYFTKDTPKPKCPILWLIYDNEDFKPPWGKVIHFEMSEYDDTTDARSGGG